MAFPKDGPPPAALNPLFKRWNLTSRADQGAPGPRLRQLAHVALEPALGQVRGALGGLLSSFDLAQGSLRDVESTLDRLARRLEGESAGSARASTSSQWLSFLVPLVADATRTIEQVSLTLGLVERLASRGADEPTNVLEALALASSLVVTSTQAVGGVRWSPPVTDIFARASRLLVVASLGAALRGIAELAPSGVDADLRVEIMALEGVVAVSITGNLPAQGVTDDVAGALHELLEPWSGVGVAARPAELVLTWLEADVTPVHPD